MGYRLILHWKNVQNSLEFFCVWVHAVFNTTDGPHVGAFVVVVYFNLKMGKEGRQK